MYEDKTIVYLGAIAKFSPDNTGIVCGVKVLPEYAVRMYIDEMKKMGFKSIRLTREEAKQHIKNDCGLKRWTKFDEKIHRGKND